MIHIANPIYDSVFKYLMEDERVARTILSALLKKEVVSVEMRRNEYANVGRRDISMFRIDFGAKVREADGRVHLVLIELQKTWLPTETLRFRQYLGAQYSNQENMLKEDLAPSRYAIPNGGGLSLGPSGGQYHGACPLCEAQGLQLRRP